MAGIAVCVVVIFIESHLLPSGWLTMVNQTNRDEASDAKSAEKTDELGNVLSRQAPLYEMMGNPLRTRIIMALADRESSPKELAEVLNEKFQSVCNQIRWLERRGWVELVDEDKRKGGVQHFYKTTVNSRLDADEWEQLPEFARRSSSAVILEEVVANFHSALLSGDFDAHRHRVLIQKPMLVDEQGMRELDESALRNLDEQERIEGESAARRIESGERAIPVRAITVVHPSPGSGLKPAG